jgi:subtilisin family serine protease
VGRRLLVVALLALAVAGSANAAPLLQPEWWLPVIGADQATPPGPGVPVAIVDSGTDPTHPEFAGRANTTFLNDQTTVGREEYHGTGVASVAAAPGISLAGVYPGAALLVYDASPSPQGITNFSAILGIQAASAHCPAVINLSFGSTDPDPTLEDALLTAFRNGCLVVAAAGNSGESGSPATYPASWPHIFTVGATNHNDDVAVFSTSSPATDVVAPGVDIIGAVPLTRNASGYQTFNGTSFASPMVAAAAAWIWTLRPTLTPGQLAQVLRSSARDIGTPGFDNESGWGMLNIPAALAAPTPPLDPAEPNDDIGQVKPGQLFAQGQAPLTTPTKPSIRLAASIDAGDDPRDLYRIWVPPKKYVHVAVTGADGSAAARIWGPRTNSVQEGILARRRDLRGPQMYGGKTGSSAYVEVLLTGRSASARYTLGVTVAKK